MSIEVDWYNEEQDIIIHHIEGRWTINELREAAIRAWNMMRDVDHIVDVIMDVRTGHRLPSGFMVHGKHIATARPDNGGIIVIVGGTAFMKALYQVYVKAYGQKTPDFSVYFAETVGAAENLIQQNRQINRKD